MTCEKVKLVKVKMGIESTFLLHSHIYTSEKVHATKVENVRRDMSHDHSVHATIAVIIAYIT
jgi:pseudouridine-5'-phosphate glycosidase